MKILDVLDYSEYSDTNISNFFSRKQFPQWGSKIIFLDVLDHSEYFDTNISNLFFNEYIASSVRKQNWKKSL